MVSNIYKKIIKNINIKGQGIYICKIADQVKMHLVKYINIRSKFKILINNIT